VQPRGSGGASSPLTPLNIIVSVPELSYGAKGMEPNPASALATWNLSIDLNRNVIRPSYKQSKRDNVDAYSVFLWTASCIALSHVFLASHSPSSWQVQLFSFDLPTLQSSCLCVGLCVGRLRQDSGCAGACRRDVFLLLSIFLFLFTSCLWSELPM